MWETDDRLHQCFAKSAADPERTPRSRQRNRSIVLLVFAPHEELGCLIERFNPGKKIRSTQQVLRLLVPTQRPDSLQ
eukprot:m.744985 g.744985  ORF g.744985 m.744985 type:complete len:77 (+) comp58953_c1_seq42:399-629(+)